MENFTNYFHKLQNPSFSSPDLNSSNNNMDLFLNSFPQQMMNNNYNNNNNNNNNNTKYDQQPLSTTCSSSHNLLDYCSLTGNNIESGLQGPFDQSIGPGFVTEKLEKSAMPMSEFEEIMVIPSSLGFGSESDGNQRSDKNNGIIRKRKRKNIIDKEEVIEKQKEVVHVRAKRGQATDSHSLAERVRRERINEKLRVLQDLVPGCYKTMGMAVMLDVITTYVRSLQNQIEFLSMKITAASMFYDFNSPEADALKTLQRTTNSFEHEMKRVEEEEYNGGNFHFMF